MAEYIIINKIRCDNCEFYASAKKFPDIYTPEGEKILKKFGWDLSDPSDKGYIQAVYAGVICPECGNFSEFDMDPDDDMLKRVVEGPEPALC